MIVAFCGHRTLDDVQAVRQWLGKLLPGLIEEGADTFYVGDKGAFDAMAASVAASCKQCYPQVRVTLVQAYMNQPPVPEWHDDALYPDLEHVPPRFAITHRNRYMIRKCDVLVAYVVRSAGNASRMRDYGRRLHKRVITFPEEI